MVFIGLNMAADSSSTEELPSWVVFLLRPCSRCNDRMLRNRKKHRFLFCPASINANYFKYNCPRGNARDKKWPSNIGSIGLPLPLGQNREAPQQASTNDLKTIPDWLWFQKPETWNILVKQLRCEKFWTFHFTIQDRILSERCHN